MFQQVCDRVAAAGDHALLAELRAIEARRREDAATEAAVLAELDRRKVYRSDGHATMWGLLRSSLQWSDGECRERMRLARIVTDHPEAGESLYETWVSVANLAELARLWAKPAVHESVDPSVEREFGEVLNLVSGCEHDRARTTVREWEQRIDRRDADAAAASADDRRTARVHVGRDGVEIAGRFGMIDGLEIAEIFGNYVDAEWRSDWEASVAEHGDDATPSMLARTDAQRRADAVTRIFRDAASTAPGSKAPEPVVNVHVDHHTATDLLTEAALFPERDVDPFDDPTPHVGQRLSRTDHGHPVDQATVLRLLLEAKVRYIVRNDEGVPIRWGRTRRLFEGAARDAVRVLSTRCTHPGCRAPVRRTETDHSIDWSKGGVTDPANGNPRCKRHNLVKNHGFTVHRDHQGRWHTYRPDGTEIC